MPGVPPDFSNRKNLSNDLDDRPLRFTDAETLQYTGIITTLDIDFHLQNTVFLLKSYLMLW